MQSQNSEVRQLIIPDQDKTFQGGKMAELIANTLWDRQPSRHGEGNLKNPEVA